MSEGWKDRLSAEYAELELKRCALLNFLDSVPSLHSVTADEIHDLREQAAVMEAYSLILDRRIRRARA